MKHKILKILYLKGAKSIPEISRKISKTVPTTTVVIDELLKEKLIVEQGTGDSNGGRKPSLYGLNKEAHFVFTIDINRTRLKLSIYNLNNELVVKDIIVSIQLLDNKDYLQILKSVILDFKKSNISFWDKILGTGISMPGLINPKEGINNSYFKEIGKEFVPEIEKVTGTKVYIENDTRVMTLGEYHFGDAQGKKNTICVNYANGIGIGMILNGELYYGKSGFSGELGHIQVRNNGILCYCGKQGCLETVASGNYIIKELIRGIQNGAQSQLSKVLHEHGNLDLSNVVDSILQGDEYALELLSKASDDLGRGLATVVHLLNPEVIVIGGILAGTGRYVQSPVQHAVHKYALSAIQDDVIVTVSKLGEKAIDLGLVVTVIEKTWI